MSGLIVFAAMLNPIVPGAIKLLRQRRQLQIVAATRSDAAAFAAFSSSGVDWIAWLADLAGADF